MNWEEENECREADEVREMLDLAKRAHEAVDNTRAVEAEARKMIAAAKDRAAEEMMAMERETMKNDDEDGSECDATGESDDKGTKRGNDDERGGGGETRREDADDDERGGGGETQRKDARGGEGKPRREKQARRCRRRRTRRRAWRRRKNTTRRRARRRRRRTSKTRRRVWRR